MPETRDPQSVIVAAEQAAATGDYASAEQLLREAARLQEASGGPLDPDLANTLNNLGIVCEITNKPEDAEQFFRRACAIATAVFAPDHPFVATSRKNLEDFCAARGKPVDEPKPSVAANPDERAEDSVPLPLERDRSAEPRPVARRTSSRPLAIGVLIAGALLLALLVTARWFRSNEAGQSTARKSSASPADRTATPSSPAVQPDAGPANPTPPATKRVDESPSAPVTTAKSNTPGASISRPAVAVAELCRDLSPGGWHCVPPADPIGSGPLFFYTRLKSPTATTIQHRWYRGDRLRRVVDLPILANVTDGYRTYSRQTVDSGNGGEWRVELRTADGVVLHEKRFVVR